MKTTFRYIGNAIYIFFIIFLVAVSSVFVVSLLPASMTGPIGDVQIKIVKSGSMEPSIPTGSIVLVRPADAYAVGDIITFGRDTRTQIPTTHRILEVKSENGRVVYSTKGDANEEADPILISERDVIGKVMVSVPFAGYVIDFARQPLGFTFLIGVPAALIILDELLQIAVEVGKMRRTRRGGRGAQSTSTFNAHPADADRRRVESSAPKPVIRHFDIPRPLP